MMRSPNFKVAATDPTRIGKIVSSIPQTIGTGFVAKHFSEEMFDSRMDPLLMVDDFVMTAPTFEPHLHAGISAVTAMFEDSEGAFLNRDTLGNNVTLNGGDLYWLMAARGAAHEERPGPDARTHALQIFVNLPSGLKKAPARALHVRAEDVPALQAPLYRVRVLLGRSGMVVGAEDTPEEMTMLDGRIETGGRFAHALSEGRQAWIYVVSGDITVRLGSEHCGLGAGTATTVAAGDEIELVVEAGTTSHFVLMAAMPIREPFVKHGPLVMSSAADVQQTLASYHSGRFGRIPA
jgi:redox-sensitive bicupin YhaK (pirin superfamily)